uniref:AB hydrolase-1 domain-containing protein n=1 Tax=Globodera pallida TaxID=36090 RepID=A0A183C915_GLOPA
MIRTSGDQGQGIVQYLLAAQDEHWPPGDGLMDAVCLLGIVVQGFVGEEDDQCAKIDLGELLGQCSILQEPYTPPAIWGRNGHIQTMAYGLLGHHSLRRTFDSRHLLRLLDGTTATFDVFQPVCAHQNGGDFTLVFCPGIANCSESNYIRTCVHLVQEKGYRCAVLNHIGVLKNVQLTSQRIFSYGGNGEMEAMFQTLSKLYPRTYFIGIGFSMGANVLTNCFAGLDREICSRVLLGISVCQGYCASDGASLLFDWEGGRRLYNYIITENLKRLLRRNYTMAVQPYVRTGLVDEQKLWSSTSLLWFDECYSRRVHNFTSVADYYSHISCFPRIKDIKIPMIFVNTLDDPLVPEALWDPVRQLCESHPLHSFVLLKHGGHLGFLEGNSLKPRSVTWLDRFILEMAEAARAHVEHSEMSATGTSFEEASE